MPSVRSYKKTPTPSPQTGIAKAYAGQHQAARTYNEGVKKSIADAAATAKKPGMFKRAGAAIARNKKTAIGVGVGAAAVGGVGGYYAMRKRRRDAE